MKKIRFFFLNLNSDTGMARFAPCKASVTFFRRLTACVLMLVMVVAFTACNKDDTDSGNSAAASDNAGTASLPSPENINLTVVDSGLPVIGRVVTVCSVKDFGAKGDGSTDDSPSFAAAVTYASRVGGGTIYVPAGKYKLTQAINIPNSVYFVGVWSNPDTNSDKMDSGTVLLVYADKENLMGKPFLSAGSGAGAMGLTIYYPENTYEKPVQYPASLGCLDGQNNSSGYSTFRYITLVNPYYGVSAGPNGNENHIVEHIYMTPLDKGMYVNMCTDIGRVENMHISAKYYENYVKGTDGTALRKSLKDNGVTGMIIQRSDWQHGKDLVFEDIHTAIRFEKHLLTDSVSDSASSAFLNLKISNVKFGIDFLYARKASQTFTGVDIVTDGSEGSAAVIVRNGFNASGFVTGGTLRNTGGPCIVIEEGALGSLSVSDLDCAEYKTAAADIKGSAFSATRVKFLKASLPAYVAGGSAKAITADRCEYSGGKLQQSGSIPNSIGNGAYSKDESWKTNIALPAVPTTPKDTLYIITDEEFGAKADGTTDNTSAIQKAMDKTAADGGGIVYMPSGKYLVAGQLKVPANVELRGVSAGPHHTTSGGTFLLTTAEKGNADGTPFITVEAKAGINGFSVWYPDQVYNNPVKYPYAVSFSGQDAWMVNVNTANCWKAIDLASADTGGHYLAYNSGMAISNVITVDGSSKQGYIYDCHYNPHFFGRTVGTGLNGSSDQHGVEPMMLALFSQIDSKLNGSIILKETKDEKVFDFFNYRQKTGVIFENGKSGKAFQGEIVMLGLDACGISVKAESKFSEELNLVAMTTDGFNYGEVSLSGAGIHFINSCFSTWNSDTRQGIEIKKGKVQFDNSYFRTSSSAANATVIVSGGEADVLACVFGHVSTIKTDQTDHTVSWETAVRDFRKISGSLSVNNCIGIEHFGAEKPGGSNLIAVYETAE